MATLAAPLQLLLPQKQSQSSLTIRLCSAPHLRFAAARAPAAAAQWLPLDVRWRTLCVSGRAAAAAREEEFDGGNKAAAGAPAAVVDVVRAVLFYATTAMVAIPLFMALLVQHPLVLLLDRRRRQAHHRINKLWAYLTAALFYKVDIVGEENLPSPDEAAVYVANHQSFLDIYALFQLGRPFKFISKTGNFFIPIVGWAMYLTGHVPLRRDDSRSHMECLKRCIEMLKEGTSVFFFPEGTRSKDGCMSEFKKGAFTIAAKAKVAVVPIALVGTGRLMRSGKEYALGSGGIKIVVRPPLRAANADELCLRSRSAIVDALLEYDSS